MLLPTPFFFFFYPCFYFLPFSLHNYMYLFSLFWWVLYILSIYSSDQPIIKEIKDRDEVFVL